MTQSTVIATVKIIPAASANGASDMNRVILTDPDGTLHVVRMSDNELVRQSGSGVEAEITITPKEIAALASAILSGDPQAKTKPNGSMALAAYVAVKVLADEARANAEDGDK